MATKEREETSSKKGRVLVAVDNDFESVKLVDFVIANFSDYDILLTHVHLVFAHDARDANFSETEEDEVLFMNNTLFPRLRYAGVKFDSELVRINGIGNAGIAAALCERAKVLQPKFLVLSKHSKNPITGFFVGSVCKKCISHAPCPVVIV